LPSNFNLNSLDDFQKNNSIYTAHDFKRSNASNNGSLYSNYNLNDFTNTKENENRRTSLIQKKNSLKQLNPMPKHYAKNHFSPQTSIRIKVIDELDGD
jgi:hypothetical protein